MKATSVRLLLTVAIVTWSIAASIAFAQPRVATVPKFEANDSQGRGVAVKDGSLCNFELKLRDQFARNDAPDDVFALAQGRGIQVLMPQVGLPVGVIVLSVTGKEGEIRQYDGDPPERYYFRRLRPDEVAGIRDFIAMHKVDELPELPNERPNEHGVMTTSLSAAKYLYVHLTPRRAVRIGMNDPPIDDGDAAPNDPSWRYSRVVAFFEKLVEDREQLEVRYDFPRPIEGLETLYAARDSEVVAVWQQEGKLCVTVKSYSGDLQHVELKAGKLAAEVPNPRRLFRRVVEAGGVEIRLACTSRDERWIIGNRREDGILVCFDKQEKRFVPIGNDDEQARCYPIHYLGGHHLFLLGRLDANVVERSRRESRGIDWSDMRTLDPKTGEIAPLERMPWYDWSQSNGVGLWGQSLPRQLQPVRGQPNVVWAAVPESNSTRVGQYDTNQLCWLDFRFVPNLIFETKDIWVDEEEQKLYVAYKGHLVRVPLPPR